MSEVNPLPLSARTTVHEYGGGPIASRDDVVLFANHPDRRLYISRNSSPPEPVTAESAVSFVLLKWCTEESVTIYANLQSSQVLRFADPFIHPEGKHTIVIAEDHTDDTPTGVVNTLALVSLRDGSIATFASGYDFYSNPRYSADGKHVCYLRWNHPDMPWTGTELIVRGSRLGSTEKVIAGSLTVGSDGKPAESIAYPKFGPDGKVYFASDRSGYWQLYSYDLATTNTEQVVRVNGIADGEFASPEWTFGGSSYDFAGSSTIVASVVRNAVSSLVKIDVASGTLTEFKDLPFTVIRAVRTVPNTNLAVFIAASPTSDACLYLFDLDTQKAEVLARTSNVPVDSGYISAAKPVSFPTTSGPSCHGFLYMPQNKDFAGPPGAKPPAVVKVHGGPTSNTTGGLSLPVQYWTSRGFAYLDLNYGGSTGFGREYRSRLDGKWGVVDVQDAAAAATYLAVSGIADPGKIVITGGSAGGFTVLLALSLPLPYLDDLKPPFATGTSSYGVADLVHLAEFTHKFELRYLDSLMGGAVTEVPEIYKQRSPVNNAQGIQVPICVFQGSEDKVVPPAQSEAIVKAVRDRGGRADYTEFEGEGHGWRQAANIKKALEGELAFYIDVLKIGA